MYLCVAASLSWKHISSEMGTAERSWYRYEKQLVRGTKNLSTISSTCNDPENLMIPSERCWGAARNPQIFLYWDTVVGSEIRLSKQLSFLTYHISLFDRLMHPFGSAVTSGSSSPGFMMVSFTQTTSTKKTWRKVTTKKSRHRPSSTVGLLCCPKPPKPK